jgi:hypothetical protein
MKAIFRVLCVLFAWVFIFTQCESEEQVNNLNDPYFTITDQAFFTALIEEGVDTDGDGLISKGEAEAIDSLFIGGGISRSQIGSRGIKDLTGIEAFANLVYFDCSANDIEVLDLSENRFLTYLRCHFNQITSIDVTRNSELTNLHCAYNNLTLIDLTNNLKLEDFEFPGNNITDLDLTNNLNLAWLYCSSNPFSEVNLSNNNLLYQVWLHDMPNLSKVCVWEGCNVDYVFMLEEDHNIQFATDCSQ